MTEMTQDQKKAFVVGTLDMPEKLYEDLMNANPKYIDNLVAAKDDLEAMFAGNKEVITELHDHVNTIIDQTFVAAKRAGMGHAEFVALICISIGGFANQVAEEADSMKGFARGMAQAAATGVLDVMVKAHAEAEAKAHAKANAKTHAEVKVYAEAHAMGKAIEEKLMKAMN